MRIRLVLVTLVVLGLVFAADNAQAESLKKQIVGTWSIVSVVNDVGTVARLIFTVRIRRDR